MKTLNLIRIVVLVRKNYSDVLTLYFEGISAYLDFEYSPLIKMELPYGYGVRYCREKFEMEPEVIEI